MRAGLLLKEALINSLKSIDLIYPDKATIEPPKDLKHGDLASNVAMVLAKEVGKNPRELAQSIKEQLAVYLPNTQVDIAGPGFLNITFSQSFWQETIKRVEKQEAQYGASFYGNKKKVNIEYVSANPTGPLHIGHGRGAAVGDALARLLRFADYEVTTEYYINDAGNQMRILGLSVWLRLQDHLGRKPVYPESYYKGDYIIDIALELLKQRPELANMEEQQGIDLCYEYAMNEILIGIKHDLVDFRVGHDVWFFEKSLVESHEVEETFNFLKEKGLAYEKDNALWFNTTQFGDDKDRVLVKSDASLTYFASDIAYHANKFNRGFDFLIDIWGADHHGYVPRMRSAITALGKNPDDSFAVVLIQLVNLLRAGTPIAMSTRSGEFDTLSDVVKEVGVDAARFMFLLRKSDSSLDFDLELVKQRTLDNPVYYVQYAHARVAGLLRRALERGIELEKTTVDSLLPLLSTPDDIILLRAIDYFEDTVVQAAKNLAPHIISYYLMDFSGKMHSYYAKQQVLTDDAKISKARLSLLRACARVLANGLEILGVSAPESM